jgi:hypothetical protein
MSLGSRTRPERRADNLTAICEPLSRQCGIPKISQPYKPPRPATGIALLYVESGLVRAVNCINIYNEITILIY